MYVNRNGNEKKKKIKKKVSAWSTCTVYVGINKVICAAFFKIPKVNEISRVMRFNLNEKLYNRDETGLGWCK